MAAPVANGFRASIRKSHITRAHRVNGGSEHLHTFNVDMLTLYIGGTHEHFAFHVHKGTYGGCGYSMLTCSCLGNNTGLTHFLCHENLTNGIIDFMSTRMVEVFTFKIELTTIFLTHAISIIKW